MRYTEDGDARSCELAPGRMTLDCYGGGTHRSWQYASLSDFITEAQLPNLRYDDGAGTVELSNGEFTVRDKNGNVVEEAEFGGAPRVFVIQELTEVCE